MATPISQMQMLFLALTRCKDQVTGSIGCSHYGAGEFTWGNPWDLPRKLRMVPAAKDEAGFPQPSQPAAAASPVALALLWCWAGLVPVSAAALPGVWGGGLAQHHLLSSWCRIQRVLMGATGLLSVLRSPSQGMTNKVCKTTYAKVK